MGRYDHPALDTFDKLIKDLGLIGCSMAVCDMTVYFVFQTRDHAAEFGRSIRDYGLQEVTLRKRSVNDWIVTADIKRRPA